MRGNTSSSEELMLPTNIPAGSMVDKPADICFIGSETIANVTIEKKGLIFYKTIISNTLVFEAHTNGYLKSIKPVPLSALPRFAKVTLHGPGSVYARTKKVKAKSGLGWYHYDLDVGPGNPLALYLFFFYLFQFHFYFFRFCYYFTHIT